jgi:hypothetical protein
MLKTYQNENQSDRIVRFIFGIILAILGYTIFNGVAQIVVYVLAFIAIFTSITGFCLLYRLFGINTNKNKN